MFSEGFSVPRSNSVQVRKCVWKEKGNHPHPGRNARSRGRKGGNEGKDAAVGVESAAGGSGLPAAETSSTVTGEEANLAAGGSGLPAAGGPGKETRKRGPEEGTGETREAKKGKLE
jgi:hypothetical protein